MKKQLLAGVAVLGFTLCVTSAQAESPVSGFKPYVSVFAGASMASELKTSQLISSSNYNLTLPINNGYLLGGAIGVKLTDNVRIEVEFSRAQFTAKGLAVASGSSGSTSATAAGKVNANYLLGNIWLDVPNETSLTPYVGGGLGLGWVDSDVLFFGGPAGLGGNAKTGMAYQLGAGIKYNLNDSIAFDLGYRFKNIIKFEFDGTNGVTGYTAKGDDFNSHNIQLGLTYSF
jgi:opacity protein-like surface antigen